MAKIINIALEGNIGSGKTSLLHLIKSIDPGITIIPENIQAWSNVAGKNLLKLMYEDKKKYYFPLQMEIFRTQIEAYNHAKGKIRIFERSPYSSAIFAKLRDNDLSEIEHNIIEKWLYLLTQDEVTKLKFDHIIYLWTDANTAYKRCRNRNRSEDGLIDRIFLKQLHHEHEKWIKKEMETDRKRIIIVDGANSWESVARAAKNIIEYLNLPNGLIKPGPDPGAAEVEDSGGGQDQDQGNQHQDPPGGSSQQAPLHKEGPEQLVSYNETEH